MKTPDSHRQPDKGVAKYLLTRPMQAARKPHSEDVDLWAISLADMMTLLLSFFIILLSVSSFYAGKFEQVAVSFYQAMGGKRSDVKFFSLQDIKTKMESVINIKMFNNEIKMGEGQSGISMDALGKAFFPTGSAELKPEAKLLLDELVKLLKDTPYNIIVEGHTDSVPINNLRYPSNWELSSARAASVVKYLILAGVSSSKLQAVGYADTRPRYSETTPDGHYIPENQAANRRVVILITPY
ncbi:MAG: OmpA family protein, partial [Nitrospirae bacterium]|nr:OmpA family protein [Nitrospirota bacterium]